MSWNIAALLIKAQPVFASPMKVDCLGLYQIMKVLRWSYYGGRARHVNRLRYGTTSYVTDAAILNTSEDNTLHADTLERKFHAFIITCL